MKLLQKLLNRINGLHYPQEYLCLAKESFTDTLHAYLIENEKIICSVTNSHLFVGYSPLILAFFNIQNKDLALENSIDIVFSARPLHPNENFSSKDAIARLSLKKTDQRAAGYETIYFFEGEKGQHRFLSPFHQFIISLANRINNKPGNVFLPSNLYRQVQIAYSIPRNISLITAGNENRYNLFPTDLHGEAGNEHYVLSLRYEGKACRQVADTEKILISTIHSQFYKSAYALGKNHMQEMKERSQFPFSNEVSSQFSLPVPQPALLSRELELQDSFIHGIHRLMIFKILSRQQWNNAPSTLAHVHNVYATWRYNKRMAGNYLLR
jgi:hypothetical protein